MGRGRRPNTADSHSRKKLTSKREIWDEDTEDADDSNIALQNDEFEGEEMPVMDLKGDSEDSADSESDDAEMGEEELTGLAAKMVRQAKLMKQKAGVEDEDDEEEEAEKERAVWGRGKKMYYSADNVDFELQSSDEEAPAEEEEEARRLQKEMAASLRPEDYEVDDSDSEDDKSDREETLEESAQRQEQQSKKKTNKEGPSKKVDADSTMVTVEQVKKDLTALSKAEQMELLMSDAPELVGLTTELQENLVELRTKVLPLLEKVKGGQGATEEGISYLEVKHMLLLSYCQAIVFYLVLKAEARSVRDHPVIGRLVELKQSLERLRPIDQKLQKQMARLLKADMTLETNGANEEEEVRAEEGNRLLQPSSKAGTRKQSSKKRKAHVEELVNGADGRSKEAENLLGVESRQMMQERARLDARAQEYELVDHVTLSKAERKKAKRQKDSRTGLARMVDDLEDDVGDTVASNGLKQRTLSQVIAEAGRPFKQPKIISGDADLPVREDLGERRRKHEIQKSNKAAAMDDNEENDEGAGAVEPEEDAFYKQARLLKEAKQAAKSAKYMRMPVIVAEEEDAEGKRHITYQMEKNRGLTPHRKKANKNPRKKYKLKHEKAVIRRKGQVREVRAPTTSYGGETSGIRTNISRSVRFQN